MHIHQPAAVSLFSTGSQVAATAPFSCLVLGDKAAVDSKSEGLLMLLLAGFLLFVCPQTADCSKIKSPDLFSDGVYEK